MIFKYINTRIKSSDLEQFMDYKKFIIFQEIFLLKIKLI